MNTAETIRKIADHIKIAQQDSVLHDLIYHNPELPNSRHEFLFFIKPEITMKDNNLNLQAILEMMFLKLQQFDLHIKDIRLLGAAYLERFDVIARHYGVINAMSRNPMASLTPDAIEKFKLTFGKSPDQVNLMGSLQFLEYFEGFDAVSLDEIWQKSETTKLAGGTYCALITIKGQPVHLINGFHPRQLIHFTEKGRSIVAFTLTGDIEWSAARNLFIGKTNPSEALPGSLRNELLVNQKTYGIISVSSSRNGFHLSAGPVEALTELIRYCSDYAAQNQKKTEDFVFGRQLQKLFSDDDIARLCSNDFVLYNGKKTGVFDLTEEKNSDEALKLLKESRF